MTKKLSAKARRAIWARMSPEQRETEERAKLTIVNSFLQRHGLAPVGAA